MTTGAAPPPPTRRGPAPARALGTTAVAALLSLSWRQVRRGAVVVVLTCVGVSALIATTHEGVFADPAGLAGVQAIAANPAIRTLFGEPGDLADPGGFTVWRSGTVIAVLLGTWTVLTTTRTTRDAEESGLWQPLLAGPFSLRKVTGWHLVIPAAVSALTGVLLGVALWAAGTGPAGAVVHGAGTGLLGLFCLAVAACCSQVFATRAAASTAAIAVLGAGLVVRMVGDGVVALAWLRWLSPFGLLGLSRPYGEDRVLPLLLLLALTAALGAGGLLAAGYRDPGGGLLAHDSRRPARLTLLGGVEGFAVRRALRPLLAWSAGVGGYYLLLGLTAVSVTDFLSGSVAVTDMAAAAGFTALHSVDGFVAAVFTLLAVPVGVFTAARMAAFTAAESDRRLVLLLAQPLHRLRLLGAEAAVTAAAALTLTVVAAAATWVGVSAAGGGLALSAALAGALNTVPISLLCLGVAVLVAGLGWAAVTGLGCLPAAGGFLLQVLTDSAGAPGWVREISPFAHLAAVPVDRIEWFPALVMVTLGSLLATAGAATYQRRDLRG